MAIKPDYYRGKSGQDLISELHGAYTPEAFRGFMLGNVEKYTRRWPNKTAGYEDLYKAREYLDRYLDYLEHDEPVSASKSELARIEQIWQEINDSDEQQEKSNVWDRVTKVKPWPNKYGQ